MNSLFNKPVKEYQSVTVNNELDYELTVFSTFSRTVPNNVLSTQAIDYYPVYTSLGTIPSQSKGGKGMVHTIEPVSRLVITEKNGNFPLKLFVPNIFDNSPQVTVNQEDENKAKEAKKFYFDILSQPYAPLTLQYRELLLHVKDITAIEPDATKLMQNNGYHCDYFLVNLMTYWYANSTQAWAGTYYCYEPALQSNSPLVLPTELIGKLVLNADAASYQPTHPSEANIALNYSQNRLFSANSSSTTGLQLTSVLINLDLQKQASPCFVGKKDGNAFIAQADEKPGLLWWMIAYNLAYAAFATVQTLMMLDMAIHVLQDSKDAIQNLSQKINRFVESIRENLNANTENFDLSADLGEDLELINIDVNTDTETDTVTVDETDTVDVVDTVSDVDSVDIVDTDVDVDVDVDFLAVVDSDIDVDVDTDIDTVTDTDTDSDTHTDTDTDLDTVVDTDINTEVNVKPGMLANLLKQFGQWTVNTMLPELTKFLFIQAAFTSVNKLLDVWKEKAEEDLETTPTETVPTGLLINYLLNPNISLSERWMTFADYAEQASKKGSQDTIPQQEILLSNVMMTNNPVADEAQKNWHWSSNERDQVVNNMLTIYEKDQGNYSMVYASLADPFNGKNIPIKVGCSVALRFLNKLN